MNDSKSNTSFPNLIISNNYDIQLNIIDTLIVKNNYPFATKVNVGINVQNFQNSINLYCFDRCVRTVYFFEYNKRKKDFTSTIRLAYVLEDANQNVIQPNDSFINSKIYYNDDRDEDFGIFVNKRQKIFKKRLNNNQRNSYDLAIHEINSPKQNLTLSLLLSLYHHDLPKGEYYLYLVYAYIPGYNSSYYFIREIANDSKTFKGVLLSNKVKLVIP